MGFIRDLVEILRFIRLALRYVRRQVKAREFDDAVKKAVTTKDSSDLERILNRKL